MVGITASDHLPSIRVRRQAEFLHGVGPLAALDFFAGVGECLAGDQVEWSLYRLDLFVDVQGWDLHGWAGPNRWSTWTTTKGSAH